MKLAELTAYAEEKYHLQEQHKWADFPGFSVLSLPHTGNWAALLMRLRDPKTGEPVERCDLKCGDHTLSDLHAPYLSEPFRMRGPKWVGITFDERTDPKVVFKLFDRALASGQSWGFTMVLDPKPVRDPDAYHETPLPFPSRPRFDSGDETPEKIRQMREMYEYGDGSFQARCRNFYRQGVFMQDYEDDLPWFGSFTHYFPTYNDLTVRQLRGYFTWRSLVRKGEYTNIAISAAYLYLYELLNGIGVSSPEEAMDKMREFETGFIDSGIGNWQMRKNLHRWMFDFAVIHGFPAETALEYAEKDMLRKDDAISALRDPAIYSDEEVFSALCLFGGDKLAESPVVTKDEARGKHLFAEIWRIGVARSGREGVSLFVSCFGEPLNYLWHPLANAVYLRKPDQKDRSFVLDECRSYSCRNGVWRVLTYENLYFKQERFQGFCHAADLKLRRYLKTGRYLREKAGEEWVYPYAEAAIEADKLALIEAAKPKITIDLSGLDRIREEAMVTRDSLLTEDEIDEPAEELPASSAGHETFETPSDLPDVPLDALGIRILRALLRGESVSELLREAHVMPSIAADSINEAMFDVFGDTVLVCEDDRLSIVDDYREDLSRLLEGNDE